VILASEALKAERINTADGEAQAIRLKAMATAQGIEAVAKSITEGKAGAQSAMSLNVAEKYVDAFAKLAKEGTAVVVPGNVGDISGMIASGLSVYGKVNEAQAKALAKRAIEPSREEGHERTVGELSAGEQKKDMKETVIEGFNQTAGGR
jgi:C-terminal region of band_7